jgi:hypothetical protein
MMTALSFEDALKACQVLLPPDAAASLIAYWQRAYPGPPPSASEVLIIASLIAAGRQQPSATTALSTASSLVDTETGRALLLLGLAYDALADSAPMTDAIRSLVAEGLQSAFQKFSRTLAQKEIIET